MPYGVSGSFIAGVVEPPGGVFVLANLSVYGQVLYSLPSSLSVSLSLSLSPRVCSLILTSLLHSVLLVALGKSGPLVPESLYLLNNTYPIDFCFLASSMSSLYNHTPKVGWPSLTVPVPPPVIYSKYLHKL